MMEIRDATAGDMGDVLAIYNDAVLNTTAVYDYAPRSLAVQQEWFATKAAQGWPVLVAAEGERVVGFCSYGPFRAWPAYHRTVECSIYVAPDRRGRGIGKHVSRHRRRHRRNERREFAAACQARFREGRTFPRGRLEVRALARPRLSREAVLRATDQTLALANPLRMQ